LKKLLGFLCDVLRLIVVVFRALNVCKALQQEFPTVFTPETLNKFCFDLVPPTNYDQELAFKCLERNLNFLICEDDQAYRQERMIQINTYVCSAKNNRLLEICTK